jgi:hypothetical protein
MDSNHRYPRERSLLLPRSELAPREPPRGGDGLSAPTGKGQCVRQLRDLLGQREDHLPGVRILLQHVVDPEIEPARRKSLISRQGDETHHDAEIHGFNVSRFIPQRQFAKERDVVIPVFSGKIGDSKFYCPLFVQSDC